jgi:hypothetical protein
LKSANDSLTKAINTTGKFILEAKVRNIAMCGCFDAFANFEVMDLATENPPACLRYLN